MDLGLFKNVNNKRVKNYIYLLCIYKEDMGENYLQQLIYHKTKTNLTPKKKVTIDRLKYL